MHWKLFIKKTETDYYADEYKADIWSRMNRVRLEQVDWLGWMFHYTVKSQTVSNI